MSRPPTLADPAVLRATLLELLEEQLEWRPVLDGVDGPADVGADLMRAFLHLVGVVAERVNGIPEHRMLAFLDLVGVVPRPASAARCPLVFTMAPGAPNGALVPTGTQVAARSRPGEDEAPVFRTIEPLYATSSRLSAVVADEPARDRFTVMAPGTPLRVFAGSDALERALVVADEVLALDLPKDVVIELRTDDAHTGWLQRLRWQRRTGDGWSAEELDQPAVGSPTEGVVALAFTDLAPVPPAGSALPVPALRAELDVTVPAATGPCGPKETGASDVPCQAAAHGTAKDARPVDLSRPFQPFRHMASGAWFALACDEAFGRPDTRVTLRLTPQRCGPAAVGALAARLLLSWSHSTADGWEPLEVEGWQGDVAADTGVVLVEGGLLTFTVPATWSPVQVAGATHHWLKVGVQDAGGLGTDEAPAVERLEVAYRWPLPVLDDVQVRARVRPGTVVPLDAAVANFDRLDTSKAFLPFGERPRLNDALYLSAGEAFITPGLTVELGVTPTTPASSGASSDAVPPPAAPRGVDLAIEYCSRRSGWRPVDGPRDPTEALSKVGTITFAVPEDAVTTSVAGETRAWLRLRIAAGDYGEEARLKADASGKPTLVDATLAPPVLSALVVAVSGEPLSRSATIARVQNGDEETALDSTLLPFPPPPDPRPSLYLGFDGALGDRPVSLHLDTAIPPGQGRERRGAAGLVVVWERWDPDEAAWTRVVLDDRTRGLTRPGIVSLLPPPDLVATRRWGRELIWLRARWVAGPLAAAPVLIGAALNTAMAEAATSVESEDVGTVSGGATHGLAMTHHPLLTGVTVELREGDAWRRWDVVNDLDGSGSQDEHVVVDHLVGTLTFGDGRRGRLPPARAPVRVSYRQGGGVGGNRPAGDIVDLASSVPFVVAAHNPVPAHGGQDEEHTDAVRSRGPEQLRHRGRAVAPVDVEDLVRVSSSDIARVRAVPASSSPASTPPGSIGVIVVPHGHARMPEPSRQLLAAVVEMLEGTVGAGVDVWAAGPGWVEVAVSAEVVPTDPAAAGTVEAQVLKAVDAYLDPLTGGDTGTGWVFGRPVLDADLVAVVQGVSGVDHVRRLTVVATPRADTPVADAWLPFPGTHDIVMAGGG
jgi:hypothetical protein